MVFDHSEKNNEPIEVHFTKGQQIEMFDLDTIKLDKKVQKAENLIDQLWSTYYTTIWNRDFMYVTKGIKVDKEGNGPELMFLGNVSYCTKANRF